MIATIEIGRRPDVFWAAAAEMAAEHIGYYALENAFRATARSMSAWCEAINAGQHNAARLVTSACSADVRQFLGELYAEESSLAALDLAWGEILLPSVGGDDPGMDWSIHGDIAEVAWTTSAGNVLSLRLEGEWCTVTADGRRHGIPWRFLCGIGPEDLLVLGMDSHSSAAPWCDGRGRPLWHGAPLPEWIAEAPENPVPLSEWDGSMDEHQQWRWAEARRMRDATFGGLARSAARRSSTAGDIIWEDSPYVCDPPVAMIR